MRNNLPITDREKTYPAEQKLISSTDLTGKIVHCNQALVEVSGFTREELIGQPHNIVRHPDMPPEAYAKMWGQLKAGQPWMGLVKNRCKNGDYYWVSAYVTPVTEKGKVIGFESVRSRPTSQDVARAEKLYARIRAGKKGVFSLRSLPARELLSVVVIVLAIALFASGFERSGLSTVSVGLLGFVLWSRAN
ncbi:MAG: aerotaxis receptor [Marinobacter excellens HL-55]|uniref:Aerotaxis receptor n=1 Tax=Marinobacter excellens HL-55 TaxID=1305731 RepID=A0A0P7ZCV6_9GAMM|nr:MAG: aerotaxis receptor [Marinobacter excellens HL-55]